MATESPEEPQPRIAVTMPHERIRSRIERVTLEGAASRFRHYSRSSGTNRADHRVFESESDCADVAGVKTVNTRRALRRRKEP
jgi:hypothetical protein